MTGLITVILFKGWPRTGQGGRLGYLMVVAGFVLLLFGMVIDVLDDFTDFMPTVLALDPSGGLVTFLEKGVGYTAGFTVLGVGFFLWLPKVKRYGEAVAGRELAEGALKAREEDLVRAQRQARIGSFRWNVEKDELSSWSEEYARILGVPGQDVRAYLKEHMLEAIHPDDRKWVSAEFENIDRDRKDYELAYRLVRQDGSFMDVLEHGEFVRGADGTVTERFGTLQDVTQMRDAEAKLRQSQKMEAVGQLTGGIAHDFNNLLAVIQGNAELLEDELGSGNKMLQAVLRSSERGAQLTQQLLAYSRKQALYPEVVDINATLEVVGSMLNRILGEAVQLDMVAGKDLWSSKIDPGQLENALLNLSINARDAMPNGGCLTVETGNLALDENWAEGRNSIPAGEYVVLSVSDTGQGMSPEIQERAFEPFFTTKEVGKGSGLGLSMVSGFVRQTGGHITIYSEMDKGTTVRLFLPRYTEGLPSGGTVYRESLSGSLGQEVILLVEDNSELMDLIGELLRSLRYEVLSAASADHAFEVLQSGKTVDLILTDVMLPGQTNGIDFVAEARKMYGPIPALYMSGYTKAAASHLDRFEKDITLLQKPFRKVELAGQIRKTLSRTAVS